jgi:hypothetical protein
MQPDAGRPSTFPGRRREGVGGAFGGAPVASILASTVGSGGYPSAAGFTIAFAACVLALALGFVSGLAIPPRRPVDAFARHEAGDLAEVAPAGGSDLRQASVGEPV